MTDEMAPHYNPKEEGTQECTASLASEFRDEKGVFFLNSLPRGHQQTRTATVKC
jgi:hypothetical protein